MTKRVLSVFLSLVLLAAVLLPGMIPQASAAENQAVADARMGVTRLLSIAQNGDISTGTAFGVGTIGEPTEYFITNRHCILGEDEYGREDLAKRVYLMLDGNSLDIEYAYYFTYYQLEYKGWSAEADIDTDRMVACDVVYYSEDHDFAILKAVRKVDERVALELADSATTAVPSDSVYSLGYPGVSDDVLDTTGLEDTGAYIMHNTYGKLRIFTQNQQVRSNIEDMTITTGTVSRMAFDEQDQTNVIQHDAEIHGGNSGGPLVNSEGKVLGINTSTVTDVASLNYAIYIDYVRDALKEHNIAFNVWPDGSNPNEETEPVPTTEPGPGPEPEPSNNKTLIIAAVILVAAIAVAAVLILKKKKPAPQPAPQPKPSPAGSSSLRFQGVKGVHAGKRYSVNGTVRFGRNPQNDIVYPAQTKGISGIHCSLTNVNGRLYLQDLGSTYGTFVGSTKLAPNQMVEIRLGDRFSLGSENEVFVIVPQGGM